jgi:hypothetical protein
MQSGFWTFGGLADYETVMCDVDVLHFGKTAGSRASSSVDVCSNRVSCCLETMLWENLHHDCMQSSNGRNPGPKSPRYAHRSARDSAASSPDRSIAVWFTHPSHEKY